jgi:N-acetylglucosaminyl-diphospho-decaprenol L-rhamnosyltransferase
MRLLVVIVNYQTADLTIDCLRSLRDEVASVPGACVVVTDNASGDESAARIAAAIATNGWSPWAAFQRLDRNGGFAAGNNAALGPALGSSNPPEYVLLLNPDTIVRPGALKTLVDFMESHPRAGIAGSRLEDPDGTPQRSAFRFPTPLSELEEGARVGWLTRLLSRRVVAPPPPPGPEATEWVAGASMIVRKAVFDAIGLLDERYFMYYEEVDFCRRAKRAGWDCWYVPASRVIHLVGQSSGVTNARQSGKRRPAYWFASRRRYFLTHCGRAGTLLADLFWATGFAQWRVRRALMGKPDPDAPRLLGDFVRYNFLRGMTPSR